MRGRRRVLLLIKGLGRGGAEQLLLTASPFLDADRFAYEVAYVLPHKDALAPELRASGLEVTCLGPSRGPSWTARLRRLVRDREIALVHSHLPYAGIGARLALGGRVRHVYTEHNVWECYHPVTRWLNRWTFPRNDHVFAVSDHVRESIRPSRISAGRRMPPIETMYHGIDPSQIAGWTSVDGVRDELGIPVGAPIVGTVANFRSEKALDQLVRSAALVRASVPEVRFVLVGQGQTEQEVRALVSQLGLEDTVVLAGHRTDAQRIASSFDVFAMSSLHEGLSIALIEALALGKPAVVTDAGGLSEVLQDGVQGFVVPPGQPEQLAGALVNVLRDPQLRSRFAAEARMRAQRFDIRSAVARTEAVYEGLLR